MYKRILLAIFVLFSVSMSFSAVSAYAADPIDGSASGSNDNNPGGTATPSGDGTTGQDDDKPGEGGTVEPNDEQL